MPKFRLQFTSDALLHGHCVIEADDLAAATALGEAASGKHGIDTAILGTEVVWDTSGATFLDNADFVEAEPYHTVSHDAGGQPFINEEGWSRFVEEQKRIECGLLAARITGVIEDRLATRADAENSHGILTTEDCQELGEEILELVLSTPTTYLRTESQR